ncbi:MAG TPA: GNAT family N-acetyltransferase, partial [Prosthecobacter sp.]|nr:GNAT family N-acetyltransferase [Prosthecobacter sp.]
RLGYPAKCILLLNRALSSPMPGTEPIFQRLPLPYQALAWLLIHRPAGQFIGNPRRHWQHLATRMVEPNKELRTWRAWACWYLAKEILPEAEFPGDLEQIRAEGIVEPTHDQIAEHLGRVSPANDVKQWQAALAHSRRRLHLPERAALPVRIRRIAQDELPIVKDLAYRIWFAHYPGIISEAQISYMLSIWYQPDAMAREMEMRDVWYALVEAEANGPVGYISFEKQQDKKDVLFINKLYVLPLVHGRGIGAAALKWVEDRARDLNSRAIHLRVNKSNAVAIRAYQRAGYGFVEDVCTDIGSGFVMDDYLMEKRLD